MRIRNLLTVFAVLSALALVAGCGSSSSSSTTSTTAGGSSGGSSSGGSTSTSSSGGATSTDVYNACIDALKGTPAEAQGQTACNAAKSAFDQCAQQASSLSGSAQDTAVSACQDAANKTVAALKSGTP
jgi:hypothetical protein